MGESSVSELTFHVLRYSASTGYNFSQEIRVSLVLKDGDEVQRLIDWVLFSLKDDQLIGVVTNHLIAD